MSRCPCLLPNVTNCYNIMDPWLIVGCCWSVQSHSFLVSVLQLNTVLHTEVSPGCEQQEHHHHHGRYQQEHSAHESVAVAAASVTTRAGSWRASEQAPSECRHCNPSIFAVYLWHDSALVVSPRTSAVAAFCVSYSHRSRDELNRNITRFPWYKYETSVIEYKHIYQFLRMNWEFLYIFKRKLFSSTSGVVLVLILSLLCLVPYLT